MSRSTGNIYGGGFGDIHVTNIHCRGNEVSLLECSYSQNTQSCSHNEDVVIECLPISKYHNDVCIMADSTLLKIAMHKGIPNGEVHLVGGLTQYEEVIEIFLNGVWQHTCFDGWNELDSRVACRQLGYLLTSYNGTLCQY